MKLIGLTGPAGCGKTTIANYMHEEHGFYHLAFATPIKEALTAMLGISVDRLDDHRYKDLPLVPAIGKSPRELMQTLGTEWGRNMINPDLWGVLLQSKINFNSQIAPNQPIVISDVRFENEADRIRNQGGKIWHITRPNNPHNIGKTHASEQPIKLFPDDIEIVNWAEIDELKTIVDLLLIQEQTQ